MIAYQLRGGDLLALDATVVAPLAASNFRVALDDGRLLLCRPSGKMQRGHVAVVAGDRVCVVVSPDDTSRGRIVHRYMGEAPVAKARRRRAWREGRAPVEMEKEMEVCRDRCRYCEGHPS